MTSRTNYYKTVSQVYRFKDINYNTDIEKPYINLASEPKNTPLQELNLKLSNSDIDVIDYDNSDIRLNTNNFQKIKIPDLEFNPEISENFEHRTQINVIENMVVDEKSPTVSSSDTCTYQNIKGSNKPHVWGPPWWYTLHNGALHYPEHAGPLHIERMKNFIIGIPIMVPCLNCKEHATAFIEKHKSKLDTICAGKDSLFKFFVDFHNQVNKRYNKPVLSYDEAYAVYNY